MAPCLVCRSGLSVINNSAGNTAVVKLKDTQGTTHYLQVFPLVVVRVTTTVPSEPPGKCARSQHINQYMHTGPQMPSEGQLKKVMSADFPIRTSDRQRQQEDQRPHNHKR